MAGADGDNVKRLADYQPPAYWVEQVYLDVDIRDRETTVTCDLHVRRNDTVALPEAPFVLNGEGLTLVAIFFDGEALDDSRYRYESDQLTVLGLPSEGVLRTVVTIVPEDNTALEGLYQSNGMYCTQCEAEGFRRITFFPDRPDVLARFTTTVRTDKSSYPLLLSNGNPVAQGEEGERHWVTWEDPFPKPCYLFALVAGDLACLEDVFVTASGREVALRLYAEHKDLDKLDHAMLSLKNAMRWDEEQYGCEYDLDIYMIVAVSHFNMGAMENKGLNIFNTSCVLAHPATTTDAGFQRVEAVVAHEYFHNWSGNRVTCRDWFQLSLKEGFTVFRDQCFSADMNSPAVKRVEDVDFLINHQFPEDQGPMSHPVRPAEYEKIDNFYTLTIYEKGAEIVRMQYHLLGATDFRKATDLYFERHDGQAVTCDDFVACMEQVSGRDLTAFKRWYSQSGTPILDVEAHQDGEEYVLTFRQHTPPSAKQKETLPLVIPVRLALLDAEGQALPLDAQGNTETVLTIDGEQQSVRFALSGVAAPSLLRGFSAPVALQHDYTPQQLSLLLAHDDDGYSRWAASRQLYFAAFDAILRGDDAAQALVPLLSSLAAVIERAEEDPAQAALLLSLPTEIAQGDRHVPIHPERIHAAQQALEQGLGVALIAQWRALAEQLAANELSMDGRAMGCRQLRHVALRYLAAAAPQEALPHAQAMITAPLCMSEESAALSLFAHYGLAGVEQELETFYQRWQHEPLVVDMWFAAVAGQTGPQAAQQIGQLFEHEAFEWASPNRVRAVVGTLLRNPSVFHQQDGEGYQLFLAALRKLDQLNPQVAARMANGAARLSKLAEPQRGLLAQGLRELLPDASENLSEVLSRIVSEGE